MTSVLLVANWLDDLGGVQTATKSLADALRAAGWRVRLASVFAPTADVPRRSAVLQDRTPWRALPGRIGVRIGDTKWGRVDRFGRARAIRRLETLAADADVIVAMDVFAAELVAATRVPHARRYFQYHNTFSNIDGSRDLARVLRVAHSFDAVIALTSADAEGFRRRLGTPIAVIPNAIDLEVGRSGSHERLIVALGRYTATKNFALLLDAWGRLSEEVRAGWKVELFGEGPERAALEALAGPGVRVCGPTAEVPSVLARASILVLPSRHEGLPMVLLEAMSCGVACVATRSSPGVEELLGDDAGWLVPVDDRDALGRALVDAIEGSAERDARSKRARSRLDRYAPEVVAQHWQALIGSGGAR